MAKHIERFSATIRVPTAEIYWRNFGSLDPVIASVVEKPLSSSIPTWRVRSYSIGFLAVGQVGA